MKIIIEENGRSVTVEFTKVSGMNVGQVIENLFRPAMLGLGFQEESLNKYLGQADYELIITEEDYDK